MLRPYQSRAVEFLTDSPSPRLRGFIQAPAGAGKTIIAASAVAKIARPGDKVYWLANTREQVEQGIAAISRVEGPEGVNFVVCCVASAPDTSDADIVVVDEAHHGPAASWLAVIKPALDKGAVVWGFSATPWHEDEERNKIVQATFVDFFSVERSEVEASGHLAKGKVYIHDLDTAGQFDREIEAAAARETIRRCRAFPGIPRFEHERRAKWQITQEYVQANAGRNAAAVSLALRESGDGHSVLMLVYSIEHGTALTEQIPGAQICHSKLPKKKRAQMIADFRSGELKVLLATSLADEGLDVPRASVLVLVAGGRAAGKLEQRAGRVLRPFEGKEGGVIHDFLDAGASFAHAQARARFRIYEKLGYSPEIKRY
jgi:superfamily II DNA or RNA helicase